MTNRSHQSGLMASDAKELQQLRYNLFQACSWLNNITRQFLQPFDITPKQYNILRTLANRHPESMSIQEVRDSLADKMSDASRLIDRLEKKRLLDKFPSEFDRRSNRCRISDTGLDLLKTVRGKRKELDVEIKDRLEKEEIRQLNLLLDRLH